MTSDIQPIHAKIIAEFQRQGAQVLDTASVHNLTFTVLAHEDERFLVTCQFQLTPELGLEARVITGIEGNPFSWECPQHLLNLLTDPIKHTTH